MRKKRTFFEEVYELTKCIPEGRVTTYGAIASYLGMKKSARMVGWAMSGSVSSHLEIPAHRVVNKMGVLTGKHHFPTADAMQQRLEAEGIRVDADQIVDFERHFWNPHTELRL